MRRLEKPKLISPTAGWLLVCLLSCLLAAVPLTIAEPHDTSTEEAAATSSASGLRVYVDPSTGELTATPSAEMAAELSQEFEKQLPEVVEELPTFKLARQGRGVFLGRQFHEALVARPTADGRLEILCLDADSAAALAQGAAPATISPEVAEQ